MKNNCFSIIVTILVLVGVGLGFGFAAEDSPDPSHDTQSESGHGGGAHLHYSWLHSVVQDYSERHYPGTPRLAAAGSNPQCLFRGVAYHRPFLFWDAQD